MINDLTRLATERSCEITRNPGLSLTWRIGKQAQRVDICLHQRAECFENHSVSLERPSAGKGFGFYVYLEMTQPVAGAGMTFVQVTLVLDNESGRGKGLGQPCFDQSDPVCVHGKTRRNGLTTVVRYTPAST